MRPDPQQNELANIKKELRQIMEALQKKGLAPAGEEAEKIIDLLARDLMALKRQDPAAYNHKIANNAENKTLLCLFYCTEKNAPGFDAAKKDLLTLLATPQHNLLGKQTLDKFKKFMLGRLMDKQLENNKLSPGAKHQLDSVINQVKTLLQKPADPTKPANDKILNNMLGAFTALMSASKEDHVAKLLIGLYGRDTRFADSIENFSLMGGVHNYLGLDDLNEALGADLISKTDKNIAPGDVQSAAYSDDPDSFDQDGSTLGKTPTLTRKKPTSI